MGNSTALGSARGEIVIDVSSVQNAVSVVQQAAKAMNTAFAATGRGGGANANPGAALAAGFQAAALAAGKVTQASGLISKYLDNNAVVAQGFLQQLQAIQKVEQARISAAQTELTIRNESAEAIARTTSLTQRLAQEEARRAQFTRDAERAESDIARLRAATVAGGTPNPNRQSTIPYFLQFSTFSAASLAGQFGAPGIANALMGVGNVLGLADSLKPAIDGIQLLGDRLRGMTGIFGQLANVGASAGGIFGAFGASLGAILGIALPVVTALALVSKVLTDMEEAAKRAKEAGEAQAREQIRVADLIASGTTSEEANALKQQEQARRNYLNQLGADAIAAGQRAFQEFEIAPYGETLPVQVDLAALTELSRITGITVTDFESLEAALATLNERSVEASNTVDALGAAILDGAFAANDAAAEYEKAQEFYSAVVQSRIDTEMELSRLTNEQVRERIANGQREIGILQANYATMTAEEQRAADLRIATIIASNQIYQEALNDTERMAREVGEAIGEIADITVEYATEWVQVQADRQRQSLRDEEDYGRRRQQQIADFAREAIRAEQDYLRSRNRMLEDFARDMAKMEADYLEAQADLIADAQEAQLEAEEEHQSNLEKILRDGRESILEAAARLDAWAVFNAKRKMSQQLADEQETYEKERADREEALAEALADLAENYEEQRQQRQEALAQALADAEANYNLQRQRRLEDFARQLAQSDYERSVRLARQREDFALEDAQRRAAFQRQIQDIINHNTVLQNIQITAQNTIQALWRGFWINLATSMPSSGGGGSPAAFPGMPAPERFMSIPALAPSYTLGGGMTRGGGNAFAFNIHFNGDIGNNSQDALRQIVREELKPGVDQALYQFFNQ